MVSKERVENVLNRVRPFLATAAVLPLLGALTLGSSGQIVTPTTPQLGIKSTYGADVYQFYCANCHGATGRGSASSEHYPAPPDLTVLARNNGGIFPRDRVRATITHGKESSPIAAHGTPAMPVWGAIFRGLDASDAMTRTRIENLVQHLESLQEGPKKAGIRDDAGGVRASR
jgi:mono/diheme cytochrome c family protein